MGGRFRSSGDDDQEMRGGQARCKNGKHINLVKISLYIYMSDALSMYVHIYIYMLDVISIYVHMILC